MLYNITRKSLPWNIPKCSSCGYLHHNWWTHWIKRFSEAGHLTAIEERIHSLEFLGRVREQIAWMNFWIAWCLSHGIFLDVFFLDEISQVSCESKSWTSPKKQWLLGLKKIWSLPKMIFEMGGHGINLQWWGSSPSVWWFGRLNRSWTFWKLPGAFDRSTERASCITTCRWGMEWNLQSLRMVIHYSGLVATQIFLGFSPLFGEDSHFDSYFSKWVETTN